MISWVSRVTDQYRLDFDKGFAPAKEVELVRCSGAVDLNRLPDITVFIDRYHIGLPFRTITGLNGLISLVLMSATDLGVLGELCKIE